MHLNSLNLIGRLVADPIFKKGSKPDGSNDRVWGRIAVQRPGAADDEVDYIPFVCWAGTARAVADHCGKGKVLILQGELRTRATEREDGTYDNYAECNCSRVFFGPDAKGKGKSKAAPAPAEKAPAAQAQDPAAALAALAANPQLMAGLAALAGGQQPAVPAADPFQAGSAPDEQDIPV